jgi:L-arabinose transport system ATP-binding protein
LSGLSTHSLRLIEITKRFPGVRALDRVTFAADPGTIHALVGENGAGKSTLLKILGGIYQPNSGSLVIGGRERLFHSAADSIAAGVAIIHQELHYVPNLTVGENLLLGHLPNRYGYFRQRYAEKAAAEHLRKMGVDQNPRAKLKTLSLADRQMVEICKALIRDAQIIAFDEPTSSLSHHETEILFRLMRDLRQRGKILIYVSHRFDEIFELCDACTVLRDGHTITTHRTLAGISRAQLVQEMVGREMQDIYDYRPRKIGPARLEAIDLTGRKLPRPASFSAHGGEILGFFGLVGAGRSELLRLVFAADRLRSGSIRLDGQPIKIRHPIDAVKHGIAFCPEDRKESGIVPIQSVTENLALSARQRDGLRRFVIDTRNETRVTANYITRLSIRTPTPKQKIRFLSGGNQQKVILARWLNQPHLKVIIMDEPTRGIDIGAKNEIYKIIYGLAERGCAVIVISSELPEVLGITDRIIVMRTGKIVAEIARKDFSEGRVLSLALPDQ